MKKFLGTIFLSAAILFFAGCSNAADTSIDSEVVPGIPVKNTVTLVDLGAKTCIPCKMMAPILEELKKEYEGRAEVIFIDVWDAANKDKARAFKISSIPTQVFFNRQGKEMFRHVGFFGREEIVEKLEELLAQ